MDLARLKSLRSKITDDTLSLDEIQAIVHCIEKKLPSFVTFLTTEYPSITLTQVIQEAGVLIMKRKTPNNEEGEEKPHLDDYLIRRNKMTNSCILILQGRVKIFRDIAKNSVNNSVMDEAEAVLLNTPTKTKKKTVSEEVIIVGPWSLIGEEALLLPEGTYLPNFSAVIDSEDIRFVRISLFTSTQFNTQSLEGLSTIEKRKRRDALRRMHNFHLPLPPLSNNAPNSNDPLKGNGGLLKRNYTMHDVTLPSSQHEDIRQSLTGNNPMHNNNATGTTAPVLIGTTAETGTAGATGDEEEGFHAAPRSYSENEAQQYLHDLYTHGSRTSSSVNRKSFLTTTASPPIQTKKTLFK